MLNETLIINGKTINVLSGDQLSTAERTKLSGDASVFLSTYQFNHPVPAVELANHMKTGLSVVYVEADSGLLLAHAFRDPISDNLTEIRGWFSNRRGLGGRNMISTVSEALADGAKQVFTSIQIGNVDGIDAITRIGGKELFTAPSKTPGKQVTVFDVTKAKRRGGI